MLWAVGLDEHLTWTLATTGTARQLQQQLESLLRRPEIRPVQQAIRSQDRSQRDLGQIHSLGQHLGADQNIGFTGGKAIQQAAVAIPSTGGIPVEAEQAQALQLLGKKIKHPLGPGPERLERG